MILLGAVHHLVKSGSRPASLPDEITEDEEKRRQSLLAIDNLPCTFFKDRRSEPFAEEGGNLVRIGNGPRDDGLEAVEVVVLLLVIVSEGQQVPQQVPDLLFRPAVSPLVGGYEEIPAVQKLAYGVLVYPVAHTVSLDFRKDVAELGVVDHHAVVKVEIDVLDGHVMEPVMILGALFEGGLHLRKIAALGG